MAKLGSIPVYPDATARDAVVDVEEGDLCFVSAVGLCLYIGDAWEVIALVSDIPEP